jgi:hypothetical protein
MTEIFYTMEKLGMRAGETSNKKTDLFHSSGLIFIIDEQMSGFT